VNTARPLRGIGHADENLRFDRTSSGTSNTDAIMEHTATPTGFFKSHLSWDATRGGWQILFQNGTIYRFINSSPGPFLSEIQDRAGNRLTIARTTGTNSHANVRITRITSPNGRWVDFSYNNSDKVVQLTDHTGRAVTYTYTSDALTSVTDVGGGVTAYTYDGSQRMATIEDARSIVYLTLGYDAASRVTQQTQADSTTWQLAYTLDAGGKIIQTDVTNPRGYVRRFTFDGAGRVLTDTPAYGTGVAQTTTYTRDATSHRVDTVTDNGNLLSLADARSNATTHAYDDMDRVTTRTDPLSRAESYTYDANGNLANVTDRKSQTTSLTYDALDRLTQRTFQGGATIAYTWDAGNRLTQLVDSVGGTITRTYDGLDRLLTEATPNGTVTYTYDAASRRASMAVPGQTAITYGYDNADRLTSITQGSAVATFDYDDANRRTRLTLPNGVKTEYAYDTASRLTGLTYKLGTNTLGTLTYTYDPGSQRTKVGGTWARTLLPAAVASATYDAANEQTVFNGQTQTYDLNGNLTGDGTNTYTWAARNRLVSISGPVPASFVYDALGRRQRKTINGTVTDFVYDRLNPVKETVGAATVDLVTGLGIDEYLTRTSGGATEYLLSEALGSTLALADGSGAVATEYSYDPFGTSSVGGTTTTNELGYTGREEDGTGVYYYRARYYHPVLQRFVSEDPIGSAGGSPNVYLYTLNSPIQLSDPAGLIVGQAIVRLSNLVFSSGLTAEEIALNGIIAESVTGFASTAVRQTHPSEGGLRGTPIPGSNYLTIGDVLAGASLRGGFQAVSLARHIALLEGSAATAASASVGGTAFLATLAFVGGYEIGGAINDLVLNNRRLLPGGNPLENFIFDHFVKKGSFSHGR
jgi:RHS repeat-associated protein